VTTVSLTPPYALEPLSFRFAALAALAGRAPIGGQREVALATYVVARLAHDAAPTRMVAAVGSCGARRRSTELACLSHPASSRATTAGE
jgi:hypothetical protein